MKFTLTILFILTASLNGFGQPQPARQISRATPSDGVFIAYEVHETGSTALVFVHGWSCDRTYWKHQVEPFSQLYKVVMLDLRVAINKIQIEAATTEKDIS